MVSFFNIAGVMFWLIGLGACSMAKGAIHESNGVLMFLIGTVFVVGAAIIHELRAARMPKVPTKIYLGPGDKPPAQPQIPVRRSKPPE